MKVYVLIASLVFSIPLLAQDMSGNPDSLSGTILVAKSNTTDKTVVFVESPEVIQEDVFTGRLLFKNYNNSIAQYATNADSYDRRYRNVSEFNVRISKPDSVIILYSDSRLVTQDMQDAINRMQKQGGTATFYDIKTLRKAGTVSLPSFKYVAPKPATSGTDLAERAKLE